MGSAGREALMIVVWGGRSVRPALRLWLSDLALGHAAVRASVLPLALYGSSGPADGFGGLPHAFPAIPAGTLEQRAAIVALEDGLSVVSVVHFVMLPRAKCSGHLLGPALSLTLTRPDAFCPQLPERFQN